MFCMGGVHDTVNAFKYGSSTWCPEHLPPPAPADRVKAGTCEVGRIHRADEVWYIPSKDRWACRRHLGILVREVVRRGEFGR